MGVTCADAYALNHKNFPQYRAARVTLLQDVGSRQFNEHFLKRRVHNV